MLISGCMSVSQPEVFKLETGETVLCNRYAQSECGMHLMECGDQKSVEFDCITHIFYDKPNALKSQAEIDKASKAKPEVTK